MLFFEAYAKTWPMCAASVVFFVGVAALAFWLRVPRLDVRLPARGVFWTALLLWFVLMAACLTLIDKPRFALSDVTKDWLFMFSAFLGIPVAMPLFAAAVWACACRMRNEAVALSPLTVLALGSFALGCAVSNIHDLIWCGAITHAYTQHGKAGYDLDGFVALGRAFGIPREVLADYATLGPYAALLIAGELLVAVASFARLSRMYRREPVKAPATRKGIDR